MIARTTQVRQNVCPHNSRIGFRSFTFESYRFVHSTQTPIGNSIGLSSRLAFGSGVQPTGATGAGVGATVAAGFGAVGITGAVGLAKPAPNGAAASAPASAREATDDGAVGLVGAAG